MCQTGEPSSPLFSWMGSCFPAERWTSHCRNNLAALIFVRRFASTWQLQSEWGSSRCWASFLNVLRDHWTGQPGIHLPELHQGGWKSLVFGYKWRLRFNSRFELMTWLQTSECGGEVAWNIWNMIYRKTHITTTANWRAHTKRGKTQQRMEL